MEESLRILLHFVRNDRRVSAVKTDERFFMPNYVRSEVMENIPRIPLEGSIDITYRCNNDCRHCWLRIQPDSPKEQHELALTEIKQIVGDARKMGCHTWNISGGEPMLRGDFEDIFDYITGKCFLYSINTNGTFITPKIAQLMRRKGRKMVSIYGANAEIHDHITRNPGSFEATVRGIRYLKEAGAGFIIQVVPMKDNYHQYDEMIKLAESMSQDWRIGAAWLYLSACGSSEKDREIAQQRLDPKDVVELDKPCLTNKEKDETSHNNYNGEDDRLFASCIASRREFHIDPYGGMTFCSFIKDTSLRYDLKAGSFKECWDEFIPSLAEKIRGGIKYREQCGSCDLRKDCKWCPVYGYLENRDYSAKVEYLCAVARENRLYKENMEKNQRRYYQIAGITIQVQFDQPISDSTFDVKFKHFEADGPGEDTIVLNHHFSIPEIKQDLGQEVFRYPPWVIYRKGNSWIYIVQSGSEGTENIVQLAVFNNNHTKAEIYNRDERILHIGGIHSLTMTPTDQVFLARVLADRDACFIHSSGVSLDGKGLLFVGHSEAGKSTMVKMLRGQAKLLCDDRIIVRKWAEGFKIHGTWSHGEVPDVSGDSAPLRAILFLQKADENQLIDIDRKESFKKLLAYVIKPFETSDWWNKTLTILEHTVNAVPCYILRFDRSGKVLDLLKQI